MPVKLGVVGSSPTASATTFYNACIAQVDRALKKKLCCLQYSFVIWRYTQIGEEECLENI